jgi:hypothetical protein
MWCSTRQFHVETALKHGNMSFFHLCLFRVVILQQHSHKWWEMTTRISILFLCQLIVTLFCFNWISHTQFNCEFKYEFTWIWIWIELNWIWIESNWIWIELNWIWIESNWIELNLNWIKLNWFELNFQI